jgi:2'-5' RNA ligase
MSDGPDRPRLVVAVLLPDSWLAALGAVQDDLRRAGLRLRYVRPEGIHLTLKFLGEVESARLASITAALQGPTVNLQPFRLSLGALGTFGPDRRPRVVWAGLRGDLASLGAVAEAVDVALAGAGFAREMRPFRPHLTLARVPDSLPADDAGRIAAALAGVRTVASAPLDVTGYALVRSELGPGGARYTTLQSWSVEDKRGT